MTAIYANRSTQNVVVRIDGRDQEKDHHDDSQMTSTTGLKVNVKSASVTVALYMDRRRLAVSASMVFGP